MKKIKVLTTFNDKKNKILRLANDEFIAEDERANELIKLNYATLVEDIIEKKIDVEVAVKEEKKEKAIKEKAVKKNAKK